MTKTMYFLQNMLKIINKTMAMLYMYIHTCVCVLTPIQHFNILLFVLKNFFELEIPDDLSKSSRILLNPSNIII